MKTGWAGRIRSWWRADFLSPKDLVQGAAVIAAIYLVIHLCGLRDYTSVLNGTTGSLNLSWGTAAGLGVTYVFAWLAFILGVPILLLAAALLVLWKRLFGGESNT